MCGIHGFFNGKTPDIYSDDYIKSAFIAGMLRGVDSSGLAVIDTKQTDIEVRKLPIPGNFFVQDKTFTRMLPSIRAANHLTIAHTRAATVGKVAEYTSHPFFFRDSDTGRELVGVHNGTLNGWASRKKGRLFDVDSNWALNNIFENGMDAFKEFYGAYCFVWWDSDNPTMVNIARNDQRELHVGFTDKGNMVFASEAGMLYWLADRHKLKLDGEVHLLKSDKHYMFDIEDIVNPTVENLPKAPSSSSSSTSTHYGVSYTTVSQVEAWLKQVMEKEKGATTLSEEDKKDGHRPPIVTREEVEDAKVLDLLGEQITFVPGYIDSASGVLYGVTHFSESASGKRWEAEGMMRGANSVQWKPGEKMTVTVLGATILDNDINIVVSKPRIAIVKNIGEALSRAVN